jgi:hypothetical protein
MEGQTDINITLPTMINFDTQMGTHVTKTFEVKNLGGADLTLTNVVLFTPDVGTTAQFTVTSFTAPTTIAAGGKPVTFEVKLDASVAGTYSGILSFNTNDADEGVFKFPVKAIVTPSVSVMPEIQVMADGVEIVDNSSVDLGTTPIGVKVTKMFTVKNVGEGNLTLSSNAVVDDDADFSVTSFTAPMTLAPQQETTFQVSLNAVAEEATEASVSFGNDDGDENPFNFVVKGVVTAPIAKLTVSRTGDGMVTSDVEGIRCGTDAVDCAKEYLLNTVVKLTAKPDAGSVLKEWSGDCTGAVDVVTVTMDKAKTCTAVFISAPSEKLTITKPANGTIITDVGGVNCGTGGDVCEKDYTAGDQVKLTATADKDFAFAGWGGDCSTQNPNNPITLIMSQNWNCTANFKSTIPPVISLTFTKPDNGTITSADGKVDCGDTCTASYNVGETVVLTAASTSADFKEWEGSCTGTENPLTVVITEAMVGQNWTCTATFVNKVNEVEDCFEQGSGLLVSDGQCVTAAKLDAENNDGSATDAQIRAGLSKFKGPFKQRDTVTLIDHIQTSGVIKIDTVDVGKQADVLVVGRHDSELYPEGFAWYQMVKYDGNPLGWTITALPYDAATQEPVLTEPDAQSLMTVDVLPKYLTVYMYSGNFVYPGPLMIYFGYRVKGENKIIMSTTPISISILPPPTPK